MKSNLHWDRLFDCLDYKNTLPILVDRQRVFGVC